MESRTNGADISTHDKEILKQIFSTGLPCADDIDSEEVEDAPVEDNEQIRAAKELEVQGVKAAEAGNIDAAIDLFQQAVSTAPEWPSAYNNRAQALRLKGDIEGAKADLDKALELSQGSGNVACQAFTQRGLILKREGNDEGAKQDFEKAANLGSAFAKQLLAAMNPYAALCNQMLCDVMHKLRSGQEEAEV
ncbi:unnamed protein product [Candidula unifasciata]|uniref:Tetratricopeptide repeat protein 36 n=1 Tax=Candidula unifasciata TaxID=100452 RepID=A0A8S3ZF29_9EUPU|nr:unnamed protein product [Candidula unifasciata]